MGKCGNIHIWIFQQSIPWSYIIYNGNRNIDIDHFSEAQFLDLVKTYKFFKPHLHIHACTLTHICVYEKEVEIKLSTWTRRLMGGKGQENLHFLRKCVVMGEQDIFIIQYICDCIYIKTCKKNLEKNWRALLLGDIEFVKIEKGFIDLQDSLKICRSISTSSWHTITLM